MDTDINEYEEGLLVTIDKIQGVYVIKAKNQGGFDGTSVDLIETLKYVKENLPEVWEEV